MKYRSSIEVIEDVLGRPLFEPEFRFRTLLELDAATGDLSPPDLSEKQFDAIASRLKLHWADCLATGTPSGDQLLMDEVTFTPLHRFPWGLENTVFTEIIFTKENAFRDVSADIRRALLYAEHIVIRDPALALDDEDKIYYPNDPDRWRKNAWEFVYLRLGLIYRLVNAGIVQLFPLSQMHPPRTVRDGRDAELQNLNSIYFSDDFRRVLKSSAYFARPKNRGHLGIALGQFAVRNAEYPKARAWLKSLDQYHALSELEKLLNAEFLSSNDVNLQRLSSLVTIDPLRCSDEDFISMRKNEELFSLWRGIVSSTTIDMASYPAASARELRALVDSRQELWRAALNDRIGKSRVLEGVLDRNAIVCGLISAGAAVASAASSAIVAAAALGGGLAVPLLNLLSNANQVAAGAAPRRAVSAHFMSLGGSPARE